MDHEDRWLLWISHYDDKLFPVYLATGYTDPCFANSIANIIPSTLSYQDFRYKCCLLCYFACENNYTLSQMGQWSFCVHLKEGGWKLLRRWLSQSWHCAFRCRWPTTGNESQAWRKSWNHDQYDRPFEDYKTHEYCVPVRIIKKPRRCVVPCHERCQQSKEASSFDDLCTRCAGRAMQVADAEE